MIIIIITIIITYYLLFEPTKLLKFSFIIIMIRISNNQ